MKRTIFYLLWRSAILFFLMMWLSSYTVRSSMGIDHDLWVSGRPVHTINHFYWPANGSLWIGSTAFEIEGIVERFDPAAAFFMGPAVETVAADSWAKRLGFW